MTKPNKTAKAKPQTQEQRIKQLGDEIKLLAKGYSLMVDNKGIINPIVIKLLEKSIEDSGKISILEIRVKYLESMTKSHYRSIMFLLLLFCVYGAIGVYNTDDSFSWVAYPLGLITLFVFIFASAPWFIRKAKKIKARVTKNKEVPAALDKGEQVSADAKAVVKKSKRQS